MLIHLSCASDKLNNILLFNRFNSSDEFIGWVPFKASQLMAFFPLYSSRSKGFPYFKVGNLRRSMQHLRIQGIHLPCHPRNFGSRNIFYMQNVLELLILPRNFFQKGKVLIHALIQTELGRVTLAVKHAVDRLETGYLVLNLLQYFMRMPFLRHLPSKDIWKLILYDCLFWILRSLSQIQIYQSPMSFVGAQPVYLCTWILDFNWWHLTAFCFA